MNFQCNVSSLRVFVLIVFIIAGRGQALGQVQTYSQGLFHQLYFNPAYAGDIPYPRLTAGYRNQWAGLGSSFVNYYAAYDQKVESLDGGLGLLLSKEKQSASFQMTNVELAYSYTIRLKRGHLSQGLSGGFSQFARLANSLSLPDANPFVSVTSSEVMVNQKGIQHVFSYGALLKFHEQYEFGFSVKNINFKKQENGILENAYPSLFVQVGVSAVFQRDSKNRDIERLLFNPGVVVTIQQNTFVVQTGSYIKYGGILGGFWVRSTPTHLLNTLVGFVGYQMNAVRVGYSYDLWIPKRDSGLTFYASHEVTLAYLFKYNDPKRKMKTVECPKFYF